MLYIHSVKLVNYKSIGDYDEAEVIIEPTVTAIIGKNESGKSNVLDGLSQIDFMGNKATAYAPERLNRTAAEGSQIKYIITIKPSPEDIVLSDTTIILSKNNYELTGGFLDHYHNWVKGYVDTLNEIIESFGGNPFKLRDQELTNYKAHVTALKDSDSLNVPRFLNALTYFHNKQNSVSAEIKASFVEALENVEAKMHDYLLNLPHFFYRNADKHLQTTYKLEDAEKELKGASVNPNSLLLSFVSLISVSNDEFLSAVRSGATPQQVSNRKKISRLVEEKINKPFHDFYQTEKISLDLDFNTNLVSFTVQSEDGAALMLGERSNGLRWYLETFIDAKAHNVPGRNVIYLFDEPGASLHVNAQKELITLFHHLSDQGNQVVYTTHSPYMLKTEDGGISRIRAVVKDSNGYTRIYKTAYDARIAQDSQKDTLAPLINALGMNLNDTFGPANNKTNIVIEGMSDYIYISLMIKVLNVKMDNYSIIPSVGASNCVNICSILHGWGCKYIAVFDYDKAGVETGGEHMHKNLFYQLGEQYLYLANVAQDDIDAKTYNSPDKKCVIEDLVTKEEIDRFCSATNTSPELSKPLIAKIIAEAVTQGSYELGDECKNNFALLFDRMFNA
ncbi:MAG: hypothetical protein E7613_04985 [Ruminococcaceae bacterium]|nr:hypothetical protein [Oscillospiraceae bacterium]